MEITFEMVEDDYVTFSDYYHQQTPRGKRAMRRVAICVALGLPVLAFAERNNAAYGIAHPASYAVYLLTSALFLAGLYTFISRYVRPMLARMAVRMGPRRHILERSTVRIARDAFSIETPRGTGRLLWKDIEDIGSTRDHVFIILPGPGGFIIPKRAFATTVAYNTFYHAMMEYFEAAHSPARQPGVSTMTARS